MCRYLSPLLCIVLLLGFVFVGSMGLCVFVFFFFFQAEDGIRDLTVTGVQTCALPIWVLQQALGTAGLTGRHRWRQVDEPLRVDGETRHHFEGGEGVFLADGHVAEIGRASCRERV